MIGHLGPHVSALLDGQLDPAAEERAWAHVEGCPTCHAEVQRQGWVKSRLACLSFDAPPGIGDLKTALLAAGPPPTGGELLAVGHGSPAARSRARGSLALGLTTAIGTGAAGAVALGVLTVVAPAANAPAPERRVQPVVARPLESSRPTGATPVRTGVQP